MTATMWRSRSKQKAPLKGFSKGLAGRSAKFIELNVTTAGKVPNQCDIGNARTYMAVMLADIDAKGRQRDDE
jgi:hypothetical protein